MSNPTVSTMQLPETEIIARVNTTTATSVGDGGGEGGHLQETNLHSLTMAHIMMSCLMKKTHLHHLR